MALLKNIYTPTDTFCGWYDELSNIINTSYLDNDILNITWVTITLRPQTSVLPSGRGMPAGKQFKKVLPSIKAIMEAIGFHYVITTELTKAGIIHFHSLVNTRDEKALMLLADSLNSSKFFGRFNLDPVKDLPHLKHLRAYMLKSYITTSCVINKNCKHEDDLLPSAWERVGLRAPTAKALASFKQMNLNDPFFNPCTFTETTSTNKFDIDFSD